MPTHKQHTVNTSNEARTATLHMRIRPSIKKAGERAAADDSRSFSSLVEKVLTDYLRERGYLKE